MTTKINLSQPSKSLSLKYALEENNIEEFEILLENYLAQGSKAVLLNSGTAAIHLALILLGIKKDDEVICQSATFCAAVNPIIYQNAIPIFIDSEEETWNMCPLELEKTIKERISNGKKPKAIIVVHLYGMPAKIDQISNIAKKYKVPLIEDAAEALGSSYKNQKCGTFGDFGILSFNDNKIITTFGGGALICKNEKDKDKAVFFSTQAKDFAEHYQHSSIGYNYRMSSLLAGVGREQIILLEKNIRLRRLNNVFYENLFTKIPGIELLSEPNENFFSTHWLSCIKIDPKITGFTREDLSSHLKNENIESRPLWKPMHLQPIFEDYNYYGNEFSEHLFKNGLCLPSGDNLKLEEKEKIYNSIQKLLILKGVNTTNYLPKLFSDFQNNNNIKQ
jgi:dTDP-4-amino-4,6-dideoxygalactose transaminase